MHLLGKMSFGWILVYIFDFYVFGYVSVYDYVYASHLLDLWKGLSGIATGSSGYHFSRRV